MTYKINQMWRGDYFNFGGVEWLMLDQEEAGGRALTKDLIGEKPFDEDDNKNWKEAALKPYMNEDFLKVLVEGGASEAAIIETDVDLKAMDGAEEYGKDKCKIAPMTNAQYGDYQEFIPKVKNPYWLVTPYSHNESFIGATYTQFVRFVRPDGSCDGCVADGGLYGVRASIVLDPETEVEITQSLIDDKIVEILAYDGAIVPTQGGYELAAGLQTLIRETAAKCEHIPAVLELKPAAEEMYRNVSEVTLYQTMRDQSVQGISARVLVTVLEGKL